MQWLVMVVYAHIAVYRLFSKGEGYYSSTIYSATVL